MGLSKAQKAFLKGSKKGFHLATGSMRGGKTHTQIQRIVRFIIFEAGDVGEVLLSAKRLASLDSNLIRPIKKFVGMDPDLNNHFKFPGNSDPIVFRDEGRSLYVNKIGASDEGSEEAVRGMTLQAWFPDELSLHPEGFITHALGRLSAGNRLMVGTTNPSSKSHHVYQKFIASGIAKEWPFLMVDNPSLTKEYISEMDAFYKNSPTMYARFILGEWAGDPDRQVIPEWYECSKIVITEHKRPRFIRPTLGMDVGMRDFTFVVFGYYDFEKAIGVVEDEYMSRGETTDLIAKAISEKESRLEYVKSTRYSDTDLRLIADMTRMHRMAFIPTAKDDKQAQINSLRIALANGKIHIDPKCENLIRHLDGAVWNEKKTEYERTEKDGHFDGVDALIYWWRNINKSNPVPNILPEWADSNVFVSHKIRHSTSKSEWENVFK